MGGLPGGGLILKPTSSIILLRDSFDSVWTLTNPNPTNAAFTIGASLVSVAIDNASFVSFFANFLETNASFNEPILGVRFDITLDQGTNKTFGIAIQNSAPDRLFITNDSPSFDLTSVITRIVGGSASNDNFSENINGSWKIIINGTNVSVSRWTGTVWDILDVSAAAYGQIAWTVSINAGINTMNPVVGTVENLYITNNDFSTLIPV